MKLSVSSSSSSQEIALDKNVASSASSALSVASSRLSAIRDSLANINNGRRLSYEYTQQTPITTPTPSLPSSLLTAFKMHNKLRRCKSDDGARGECLLDDCLDDEEEDVKEEYDILIDNNDTHAPGQKFVQFVPSLNYMGAIMAFLGSEARRDDGEDVNIMYMHASPVLATKNSSACTHISGSIEEEDADDTMSTELDEDDVHVDDTFMTRDVMLQVARNDIHIDADFTSQDTDLQPLEPGVLNSSTPAEEMSSGRPLSATSEPTRQRQQETELLLQPQPEIKSTSISKQIQAQLGFVAYETHTACMQRMRRIEKTRSASSTTRPRSDKNNKSNSKKKDSLKSEADASQQQRRLKKITKLTMKNAKKKDITPIAAAPLDHPLCHSTFATSA